MKKAELIEFLGELIDIAEDYAAYSVNLFTPLEMKADAYLTGLRAIREKVYAAYIDVGGVDWWKEEKCQEEEE